VLTSTLHQSALLTLSPGIAICGVACFQLIAAIDHPQVFVGVQLVKQRHVEVPRHTEVVRDPNLDKPSSYVRSQASGRHGVPQKQARGNLKVSWYAAERYRGLCEQSENAVLNADQRGDQACCAFQQMRTCDYCKAMLRLALRLRCLTRIEAQHSMDSMCAAHGMQVNFAPGESCGVCCASLCAIPSVHIMLLHKVQSVNAFELGSSMRTQL